MIVSATDPIAALMLTHFDVSADGSIHSGPARDLRRRQRRFARHARLRKLLG
jgi:hypothetical protein